MSLSPEDQRAQRIVASPAFQAAVAHFAAEHERFVRELIQITEVPAPPFGEQARGELLQRLLRESGLPQVSVDGAGNVLAPRPGRGGPLFCVAAHLDTVFPAGTDVRVSREGHVLRAPGVGDDSRSLALLLALIRALNAAGIQPASDLLFVANVGEEGPGDLRGARYLFTKGDYRGKIARFMSIDGFSNDLVTNGALGSKRYRVTYRGPGGHSWSAFGLVSPSLALGAAMAKLGQVQAGRDPKVSYNVGAIGGGTSVNSIPYEAWMEVDLRSTSPAALDEIAATFQGLAQEAAAEENAARSTARGPLTVEITPIGDRPSGKTPPDSPVLRQVAAAMRAHGKTVQWNTSSTDSNIPISLGIPAFTIAAYSGDRGGNAHALDEWVDVEPAQSAQDFALALTILLSVAEME